MLGSLARDCLSIGFTIKERIDLNREAAFGLPIDFYRDVRKRIDWPFQAITHEDGELTRGRDSARKPVERRNQARCSCIRRGLTEGTD